jgi:uncharacterized phage-associated protein
MKRIERNRLLNAMIYFAQNTKNCGKVKLFKLLYLLDFEHFRQTGRSLTGINYEAWELGPVPRELYEHWGSIRDYSEGSLVTIDVPISNYVRSELTVTDGTIFDDSDFTPRQLKIMKALVDKFGDTLSGEMVDVTHAQNGAWNKVWCAGKGKNHTIPYELGLADDDPLRDYVLESAEEASYKII